MSNVTIYKLNSIKQLIDLNKDKKNFELDFKVDATDGKHFEALVVTQEMLDSETPLEYQKAEGFISGKIVADKDIYQNYFLLLRSNEPVECQVSLALKDILPNIQEKQDPPPYNNIHERESILKKPKHKKKSWLTFKNLVFVGLILLGALLIWYFYFNKKSEDKTAITPSPPETNLPAAILNTSDITNEISDKMDKISDGLNLKLSNNLSSINENINNKLLLMGDGISAKVSDGLNSRVDGLNNRVDSLNNLVPKLTDGLNSKVDNISNKVDGLEPKISNGIKNKIESLGPKITDDINTKISALKDGLTDGISNKMSELKDGINDKISSNIGEIKTQMEKIKTQSKNDLGNKNDAIIKKIKDFKIPDL